MNRELTKSNSPTLQVGRYSIFGPLASGGMATVHLAKLVGSAGFSRVVAVKRMHRDLLLDPEFREMFVDEARLAARISHPNVVPVLDVISHESELVIVMDYVHGSALHVLMRTAKDSNQPISVKVGSAIIAEALHGLHAAHEARDEKGAPLDIVHRDVSPQNILVGTDGVARVLDFGIAKAIYGYHQTTPGTLKGKLAYMAPEVLRGDEATRQADVFSAGVVFWEVLTGRRLFGDQSDEARKLCILSGNYPSARHVNPKVSAALDLVVKKSLEVDTRFRYRTALEFAIDIERVISVAPHRVVSEWVRRLVPGTLERNEHLIHEMESSDTPRQPSVAPPPPTFPKTPTASIRPSGLEVRRASVRVPRKPARRIALGIAAATFAIVAAAYAMSRSHSATSTRGTVAPERATANTPRTPTGAIAGDSARRHLGPMGSIAATHSPLGADVRPALTPQEPLGAQAPPRPAVLVRRKTQRSSSPAKPYLPRKL